MTAPKLATSRPAALTGRVGHGGDNRIQDVALIQALLGVRRDKRARPYLCGHHVTGKYDRVTADTLMRYRLDRRDAENGLVRFISPILCIARPSTGSLGNA